MNMFRWIVKLIRDEYQVEEARLTRAATLERDLGLTQEQIARVLATIAESFSIFFPLCASCEIEGLELGVVGTKGFVGGFPGSALPDFGEPLLRRVYAETSAEADAIARGLQAIVHCDIRIVLLHYSPVVDTLEGEPPGIYTYLGSERLATPIAENGADLVLHGHAHAGSFQGCIGDIPVYNVAVHVTGRSFWIVELDGSGVRRGGEVVEVREPQ